jgi:Uncharacterized conserved protein
MADYTRIWWDIRPHPRFGTLEIRIADQPTSLARTELLVGVLRQLVEHAPPRITPRGDYANNRVAAASRGLDALLIHPTAAAWSARASLHASCSARSRRSRRRTRSSKPARRLPRTSWPGRYGEVVATQSDTVQVSGIRCERCVHRLAGVLTDHEGLESANANLMGVVTLEWDDERTTREELLEKMRKGGFPLIRGRLAARAGIRSAARALRSEG